MKTLRDGLNRIDREYSPDLYNLYEIAKQMDALLEECYWALQCPIKSQVMVELLKNNGYGNA